MNILFIAPTLPINNGSGGSIRSFQLYMELLEVADVDVMTAQWDSPPSNVVGIFANNNSYLGHIRIPWERNCYCEYLPLNDLLKECSGQYDYIFIRYYNTAYWLGSLSETNLILDCDDCYNESTFREFSLSYERKVSAELSYEKFIKNLKDASRFLECAYFYNCEHLFLRSVNTCTLPSSGSGYWTRSVHS